MSLSVGIIFPNIWKKNNVPTTNQFTYSFAMCSIRLPRPSPRSFRRKPTTQWGDVSQRESSLLRQAKHSSKVNAVNGGLHWYFYTVHLVIHFCCPRGVLWEAVRNKLPIIPIHAEGETHGSDVDQRGLSAKISCKPPKAGTKAYKLLRTEALNHLEWEKMKFWLPSSTGGPLQGATSREQTRDTLCCKRWRMHLSCYMSFSWIGALLVFPAPMLTSCSICSFPKVRCHVGNRKI